MNKSCFKIILTSKETGEITQYDNVFAYGKDFLEYKEKVHWDPNMFDVEVLTKCCICGKYFSGYGNDPWPVYNEDGDHRCCDDCNLAVVVPARIEGLRK